MLLREKMLPLIAFFSGPCDISWNQEWMWGLPIKEIQTIMRLTCYMTPVEYSIYQNLAF